jgi:hypothetical protein
VAAMEVWAAVMEALAMTGRESTGGRGENER